MNYKHKCDVQLAQWLIDCVEEKPIQKKASTIDTTMMPYKLSDRADQLKTSVLDQALEDLQAEEQKDDQSSEQTSDSSDIEKRISEAKTPEELEAIEKELSSQGGQSDQQSSDNSQPEQTDQSAEQSSDQQQSGDAEQGSAQHQGDPSSEIESLKKEIKDLKGQIEKINGEEKLKNDIKELREKLDNVVVQHNPDLNQTINQSASKIKYFKRAMRRISKKASNEFDDYAKEVAKGIFEKVGPSLKKYMGITEKTILEDIDNEDLRMKMYAQDYYQEDKSVAEAIKGLYKELMDHYHGSAAAM